MTERQSLNPRGRDSKSAGTRRKKTAIKKQNEDEFMAASIGDLDWLKQSLKAGGNEINYDKNGFSPIHLASIHGRLDCLKYLIEKLNVDVNLPSKNGWTCLHLCINNQTGSRAFNSMVYLLSKGAIDKSINNDGITPAHQAASEGHVKCLKVLLQRGIDVDVKDKRGYTPLDLAKIWGNRQCARLLSSQLWHQRKEFQFIEDKLIQQRELTNLVKCIDNDNKVETIHHEDKANSKKIDFNKVDTERSNNIHTDSQESQKISRESFSSKHKSKVLIKPSEKVMKAVKNVVDPLNKSKVNMNIELQIQDLKEADNWNYSTHTLKPNYVPNLNDYCPRDEFTLLPTRQLLTIPTYVNSLRKEVENFPVLQPLNNSNRDNEKVELQEKNNKFCDKMYKQIKSKNDTQNQQVNRPPLYYKAKDICYSQTKRKYEVPFGLTSETPFHLTNDKDSYLIKCNTLPENKVELSAK